MLARSPAKFARRVAALLRGGCGGAGARGMLSACVRRWASASPTAVPQRAGALSFDVVQLGSITELGIDATLYRHRGTGCDVLSLRADDENKVFGVAFRTPPSDSTGVAHILEHSVLCGSRKYPGMCRLGLSRRCLDALLWRERAAGGACVAGVEAPSYRA
jgi:hypothetical protein